MRSKLNSVKLFTLMSCVVLGLSLSSCGWKASEEEIHTLEETRSAALDAEKNQQAKKSEADDLQSQVDAKKAELERAKAEKEKVVKALDARHSADSN